MSSMSHAERPPMLLRACRFALILPISLVLGASADVAAQDHVHEDLSALAGAPLPHDIPDFCAAPTVSTVGSGAWSNPAIWSVGRLPVAGEVVNIAEGTNVTYDVVSDAAVRCLAVNGRLAFRTDVNTRLTVATMMVMRMGELVVGSAAAPVDPAVTAEIVVANRPIDLTADPEQFGTGFLGFGIITMHGALRAPTWLRVSVEPRVGHTTLTFAEAISGWRVGDRLILPDTRHLKWNEVSNWKRIASQREELTVQSISSDRKVITLNQSLRFDHLGARDSGGALRLLPHVGNLTRNVVVRSQSSIGSGGVQGHVLFTERATVDIRYALFRDLGRTLAAPTSTSNQIGRYPVHFHHLFGPVVTPANGYQYTFVGNAIDGGSTEHKKRWAVAIHNTHYGLVSDNVLYNYAGALLTTEDGSESFNLIERNFVTRSGGTGGRLGDGNEGMGFWFRGPNNYVRGNVAADFDSDQPEAAYGYKYFMRYLGSVNIPTAKGSTAYTAVNGNALPVLEFKNNEVYSAAQGLTYWWLSSEDPTAVANPKESVFEDLRIWHVFNVGVYHYPAARVRLERLLILGRDPASTACCGRGFHGEDYSANDIRIVNSEIQGMITGVVPSAAGTGVQTIENSTLKNQVDVSVSTMYSANGGGWLPPRKTVLTNVKLLGARTIDMDWSVTGQSNTTQKDELLVYSYQGNASDNFRVYYDVQATQNVAGGLAPCYATRAEISGIVCGIAGTGAPALTSVTPSSGSASGGTVVKITGGNFAAGAAVTFGSAPAAKVVVDSASQISATTPAAAAGLVNVTVRNADGRSATLVNGFTFVADAPCTYSLSPTSASAATGGSSGSVSVTAGSACSWTAVPNAPWITVTSGSSGSGSGSVGYSVAANADTVDRTGTVTIGGQTFTITQPGAACAYTVSPQAISASADTGTTTITITAAAGCAWTATSHAGWITPPTTSSSGNGSLVLSLAANADATQRTGFVGVAGVTVTVTQAAEPPPPACTYSVSPVRQSFGKSGGPATIAVTTGAGCQWTATPAATWVTMTAGATGTGPGVVSYSVASNSASGSRKTTIAVADQVVRITQAKTARTRQLDFDGDNIDDSLLYDPQTGAFRMETATTDGFELWSSGAWPSGAMVRAADFNADGLSDVLIFSPATGAWTTHVNKGTTAFTTKSGSWPAGTRVFVLDLNGDSRSDVFAYVAATGSWWKYMTVNATPGTFTAYAGAWQPGLDLFPANLNGDAKADLLAYDPSSGAWFKALNTTIAAFEYVAGKSAWDPRLRLMVEDFGNGSR
jgi:hypothetical protein